MSIERSELLRKAAEQVRADSREDVTILLATAGNALADWLDYTAELLAVAEDIGDVRDRPFRDPLAIARVIVGEQA